VVTGRLTIPTADGDLLHYSAVASEPLESKSQAPAAPSARKVDASPFRSLFPPGGLMEQSNASLQRGRQS